jgi:hypothetical protein
MMGNLPLVPFETRLRHQAGSANEGWQRPSVVPAAVLRRDPSCRDSGSVPLLPVPLLGLPRDLGVAAARSGPGIAPRSQMLKLGRIPAHNKVSANCG